MSDTTYAFVDIETTGSSPTTGRITEIAIIIMKDNKVLETFQSLVNPETTIPPFITKVTGIDDAMVQNAPLFADIAQSVWEKLQDCVFVAHNVSFDYGFLKNEFKRFDIEFTANKLCTVKLSRQLYPEHRRHGLDALIERFDLDVESRHRALDDCQLMIDLWHIWHAHDAEKLITALAQQLRGPILPKNLAANQIENLPETPGVYYFYADKESTPLYIGKGVDIRKRVLRHFSGDHLNTKQAEMVSQIGHIDYHQTTGELGALLHETEQIKQHVPAYNRQRRQTDTMHTLVLQTEGEYHIVNIEEIESSDFLHQSNYYGSFKTQREAEKVLESWVTDLGLCEQLPALKYNLLTQQLLAKYKLKNWWFEGPIAIKEHCSSQERTQVHVFDQWCYLGTHEQEDGNVSLEDLNPPRFDMDHYKILQRFFRQPLAANVDLIKLV